MTAAAAAVAPFPSSSPKRYSTTEGPAGCGALEGGEEGEEEGLTAGDAVGEGREGWDGDGGLADGEVLRLRVLAPQGTLAPCGNPARVQG